MKMPRSAKSRCLRWEVAVGAVLLVGGAFALMGWRDVASLRAEQAATVKEVGSGIGIINFRAAAVEQDSQDSERLFTLLVTDLRLKQMDKARRDLGRVRERFPNEAKLAYRIGELLIEYQMLDEAEREFSRAANLMADTSGSPMPSDLKLSEVYLQLARLRFDHQDYWGTLNYFDRINLEHIPSGLMASALHLEGQALVGTGRPQEALGKLSQAGQLNSSNPEFLVHLIWADFLAADFQAAAATAEFAAGKWPNVPDVHMMQALRRRESNPERQQVPFSQEWHLRGEGLVCCPCEVPCPCRSNAPPTYGHCENAGLVHIEQGHYGRVSLAGLSIATINGTMNPHSPPVALYVDRSATDEQIIAIERLTQTFDPLHPSILLNVERSEISYRRSQDGKSYEVEVPGVLHLKIRRQLDRKGRPLYRTAALDDFSNTLEYARNLTYKVWNKDGSLQWDFSGRQANFRRIDLDCEDYKSGKMLKQFADGSGHFNRKQSDLIKELGLPTLAGDSSSKR
jgi:hypothetical protein